MQKTILITGCSSGIGLCAAQTLKDKGYRVFATARKQKDLDKLTELGLESFLLDVDDSDSIKNALQQILERTQGTLDALFNNAGYAQPGAVEDLSRDMIRQQFETNVFGTIELTNLVLPIMRKQGFGRIIFNTSILGVIAMPYRGAYNASKYALEGFANTLRLELRNTPIKVSIIAPGPILSKFRNNAKKAFQVTLQGKNSIHQVLYKKMEKFFFSPEKSERRFTLPPIAVTKQLLNALESKHPQAHYYIGFPAKLFAMLRRLLPDWALDWIIHLTMKGEAK